MILRDIARTLPSGAPVAAGTEVKIFRERDNALLGTVTTDANGMFEFKSPGNPGVLKYEVSAGAGKKIHSTRSILPVADLDLSGVRPLLSTFLDGVVVNYRDALAVTSDGLSMQVEVGAGVATARGVIYRQDTAQVMPIPAAVGNPRIDVIAIRFWLDESGDDVGRCELIRKEGNAALVPVAPTLEQTSSIWETPLAEVAVDVGTMGIALNKVNDTRLVAIPFIPDGTITKEQLASDLVFGVPYVKNGHTTVVVEGADRLNFDEGFTVTKSTQIATQADVNVNYGATGTSTKVAREDHTHNLAVMDDSIIPPRTITGDLNNQHERVLVLPPVKSVCKVRAFMRVASTTGGPVNGTFWVNIAGERGAEFPFQADAGVDSLLIAMHTYETAGGTRADMSWGIKTGGGSLNVTGGWLDWEAFPIR